MIFPQNLHTHTIFGDGRHSPEEMAAGAVRSGCASLGFSEHSPLPEALDPGRWTMPAGKTGVYRREVLRLKETFAGQLEIFLGLEQDIDSAPPEETYDYLIGSVHGVRADGVYLSVDESPGCFDQAVREHFGGDSLGFVKAYYRREAGAAAVTNCQIIGHFDLVAKFNEGFCRFDEDAPAYRAAALEALEAVMERDVIFEINTGAISRGYRTAPYPAMFLLKAVRKRKGRICITSDSHSADTIVCAFSQAAEAARSCGFRETWMLTGQGWKAVDLTSYLP